MTRRRDAQERERKRLRLLDIAASEFARVGFDQANINTISERAGFGKGTVYLYTASKEQLFLDVLQEIGNTLATWTNPPVQLWIGINSLNFIAPVVILVYAIWGRWPLPPPPPPVTDDALVIDEIDQLTKAVGLGGNAAVASTATAADSSAAPSSGRED